MHVFITRGFPRSQEDNIRGEGWGVQWWKSFLRRSGRSWGGEDPGLDRACSTTFETLGHRELSPAVWTGGHGFEGIERLETL